MTRATRVASLLDEGHPTVMRRRDAPALIVSSASEGVPLARSKADWGEGALIGETYVVRIQIYEAADVPGAAYLIQIRAASNSFGTDAVVVAERSIPAQFVGELVCGFDAATIDAALPGATWLSTAAVLSGAGARLRYSAQLDQL